MAKRLAKHYNDELNVWLEPQELSLQELEQQLQRSQKKTTTLTQRYQEWQQLFTEKLGALGFTTPMQAMTSATEQLPAGCAQLQEFMRHIEAWQKTGSIKALKTDIQRFEDAWRSAASQPGRTIATEQLYWALEHSLQTAQAALKTYYEQQLQVNTQKQTALTAQQTARQAQHDHLKAAQQTLKPLLHLPVMEEKKRDKTVNTSMMTLGTLPSELSTTSPSVPVTTSEPLPAPKSDEHASSAPEDKFEHKPLVFWSQVRTAVAEIAQSLGGHPMPMPSLRGQ